MFKSLFGCQSIEKILFYLLINERCYAQQIHRMLHTPLTPIQKALTRLEQGGILISYQDGKARIYQFNPDYPLLAELEMLLKKAFHHLSLNEKKGYYYLAYSNKNERRQHQEILQFIWNALKKVTNVTLIAKSLSKQQVEWHRKGNGTVSVKHDNHTLIFQEQGHWQDEGEQLHHYHNRFRWTWDRLEGLLSVEHLRLGEANPVFLFHLIPTKGQNLESLHPHLCGEDTYFGWLHYTELFLQLNFRTIGPKKNEEIQYIYT